MADKRPEVEIQKLSDAYEHDKDIPLELKCTIYNINPDNNENLKSESYVLDGYTIFVEKVKEYILKEDENAVTHAIEYCIKNNILRDFFESRKDEVRKNMTLDMTFEAREKMIRRDEFAAGKDKGRAEGRLLEIISLVKDGLLPMDIAANRVGMTVVEFEKVMANDE